MMIVYCSLELKKDKEKLSLELASLHINFDELELKYKEQQNDQRDITAQLREAIESNSQLLQQQQVYKLITQINYSHKKKRHTMCRYTMYI